MLTHYIKIKFIFQDKSCKDKENYSKENQLYEIPKENNLVIQLFVNERNDLSSIGNWIKEAVII